MTDARLRAADEAAPDAMPKAIARRSDAPGTPGWPGHQQDRQATATVAWAPPQGVARAAALRPG